MSDAEAVVREYIDACNATFSTDDRDKVLSLLHPDVQMHENRELPGAVSAVGLESVSRYLQRFGTYWQDFRWEPLSFETAADRVLVPARLHLTGRESGIAVAHEWIYVFAVHDGKLLRQDAFGDREEAEAFFRRD